MKQNQTMVMALLILLIATGWLSILMAGESGVEEEYNSHLELAKDYYDRELYQKAIEEYKMAISIAGTEENWVDMFKAYAKRYEENDDIYNDYLDTVKQAANLYVENDKFKKTMVELYLKENQYETAYDSLMDIAELCQENKTLNNLINEIKYSYELKWKTYYDYKGCINEFYTVDKNGIWAYTDLEGEEVESEEMFYAGPVGENGVRAIIIGDKAQLVDSREVIQGYFNFIPKEVGVFAENYIPVKKENKYSYYDILGDIAFGSYDYAGTFKNGEAAVMVGDKWWIINIQGEKISINEYDDIVLNIDGTYLKDGLFLASKDGTYRFYNEKEENINEFVCDDIDIITDDKLIAFKNNGKWGFVDTEGNEIINPSYVQAKSFSNGLAAVFNGEKWGFIDKSGNLVIDYCFLNVDYFNKKGVCMVESANNVWQFLSLYIKE